MRVRHRFFRGLPRLVESHTCSHQQSRSATQRLSSRAERLAKFFPAWLIGAESRDPEHMSFAMPPQGILTECYSQYAAGFRGLFLRDRSSTFCHWALATPHHATGKCKPQAFTGTGDWENSLRQHGHGQSLGILRLRAHHSGEAPLRPGASLRGCDFFDAFFGLHKNQRFFYREFGLRCRHGRDRKRGAWRRCAGSVVKTP